MHPRHPGPPHLPRRFAPALLALAILAAVAPLRAQERLAAETLAAWTHTGEAPTIDPDSGAIVLPAGSQLSRTYAEDRLAVRLVARPFFGARSESWPALEIGPASVSFIRDAAGGGLVLLGDEAVALPDAIELDGDGRSIRTLDLRFSYTVTDARASLALDGASYSVTAFAPPGAVNIALSAGAEAGWVVEILGVEARTGTFEDAGAGIAGDPSDSADPERPPAETTSPTRPVEADPIDAAVLKIEAGDPEAATALLGNATVARGTLAWYQTASLALLERAEALKADGQYTAGRAVASAAITLMEHGLEVAGAAASQGERAEMLAQLGWAAERHIGDRAAARRDYERTIEALPGHPGAKEALTRFDEAAGKVQRLRRDVP